MGTTSTLNVFLEEAKRLGRKTVYIDLRSLSKPITATGVWSSLLLELGYETDGNIKALYETIRSADAVIPPLALAIDEFDLVQSTEAHSLLTRLTGILPSIIEASHLMNNNANIEHSLTVLIGSRQSLFDIERATQCIDSPWYQMYQTLNLRPIGKKDAMRLVLEPSTSAGTPLDDESSWLIKFAGTWPFFLKLACHHAFQYKHDSAMKRLNMRSRRAVEESVWEEALPHLDTYWGFLTSRQRDILINLDMWSRSMAESQIDPDTTKLSRDGIVRTVGDRVNYTCDLFSTYFSKKHDDEPLLGHAMSTADSALISIAETLSRLGICASELSQWDDSTEKNIQEISYVVLRSQYQRVSRERHAGEGPRRDYRCDLRVDDVDVLVEIKRVRSLDHVPKIQVEINDDLAGYRSQKPNQRIVFLIWDRQRYIADREYFRDTYETKDKNVRIVFAP